MNVSSEKYVIETKASRWITDAMLIAWCVVGGLVWMLFFWALVTATKVLT